MTKLTYEDKVKIYLERKEGKTISYISSKYNIGSDHIKYMIRLIDRHGYNILLQERNISYPTKFKEEAINRVLLNNESIREVAIDLGLPSHGVLTRWLKLYKENCYNIVEPKRKRRSTMTNKNKKEETKDEKIKRLEIENEYLKAELEYSKKLRAVVQARKNQQQKNK